MTVAFDYVLVGAGAAGCVLARRLVDSGATVLLLEAGGEDRHPYVRIPAGFFKMLRSGRADWGYSVEPQAGLDGRAFAFPRGRIVGGSGSINGMVQAWGLPYDFDRWAAEGCNGWSFQEVLPYFMKSEHYADGDPRTRGRDGPMMVSGYTDAHPVAHDFLRAATELGVPVHADYNSNGGGSGVGLSQQTRRGRLRETAATAYLQPVRDRPNLEMRTNALACNVLTDQERRATGVVYRQGGRRHTVRALREVVLCGGAINTPHLLQLSGIGDGPALQAAGIVVRHHLPGVGQGLQDHYAARVVRRVHGVSTLNQQGRGARLVGEVLRYLFSGRGILTYSPSFVTGHLKSEPVLERPDLQVSFIPGSFRVGGKYQLEREPGITLGMWQMRPESRGYVRTLSPDPDQAPAISPAYLESPVDQRCIVAALHWCRRFLYAHAFDGYGAEEVQPGAKIRSDEALLSYARQIGGSVFHAASTCRMGVGSDAVVDPELKVHGIRGLRLVDASIMPHLTSANTHAPTVMIAEKAADLLLQSTSF
ncbi:GMC family oxidoreductase [Xylophilus sp. GOD-11R]|uniref:GMC family oxidoreductase n=1 Tax=Xylophilus sp. GOD-11R TaxID=3089814 RepID=UPI00298BDC3D|nr:GMC family oxidoreductase N-terminal domain-containing protein [Xylophilus sp. GOD-11R]WPB55926.1 GMC family oxidoreductase N-terminal domain-containing protein [Xylophilus sp. GOD-11R]